MMRRFAQIHTALLLLVATTCLLCSVCYATSRASPGLQLTHYGFPSEPSVLAGYLHDGIPSLHVPPADNRHAASEFVFNRWKMYRYMVEYLGRQQYVAAAPVLREIVSGELSPVLQRDLDVFALGSREGDSRSHYEVALNDLRAESAEALARINDRTAIPIIKSFYAELLSDARVTLEAELVDYAYLNAFSQMGFALTAFGEKDALQAHMELLELAPIGGPERIVNLLMFATGQRIGPVFSQSLLTREADLRKWRSWWAENKDTFSIDREGVLNRTFPKGAPAPQPDTLSDHLQAASLHGFGTEARDRKNASVMWLEENGASRIAELERIINDRHVGYLIRREAFKWYAKFHGDESPDLYLEYAVNTDLYTHPIESLQAQGLRFLDDHFPDLVDAAARECLSNGTHYDAAFWAIDILKKNPENLSFLEEQYFVFPVILTGEKYVLMSAFLGADEPASVEVFADALQSEDDLLQWGGQEGIRKFGLVESLDDDGRKALEAWDGSPGFLIGQFNREENETPDLEFCRDILRRVTGTDKDAALAFRNLYVALKRNQHARSALMANPVGTKALIDDALDGFMRCVDTYAAERNRDNP